MLSRDAVKLINILVSSDDFVSGSRIAQILGVSRATVNRLIRELEDVGFVVESHPRLGYRISIRDDLERIGGREIFRGFAAYRVEYMKECSSTQDVVDLLAREGAPEGTTVVCEKLSRGRGRLGRRWEAGEGGLWFTILLRPPSIKSLQLLSLAGGVSVAKSIRELFNIDARVKWPNDVIINERKVCGILIEARAEADRMQYVMIGIGINVNNTLPQDLQSTAITIKSIVGVDVPRAPLLKSTIRGVDSFYRKLLEGVSVDIVREWSLYSSTIGRRVKAVTPDVEIEGVAVGLDEDGALMIEIEGREVRKVIVGDIIHLREYKPSSG
ncbi:MAG: biotin--[acetyl-CoA-carboxylase] ligase [Ignisphaera sp.]|nr:biotin--[acetyl-CoA-carboxylase] ligase [Ignisphaera sp.]MDW8084860.1 biotin--[acetyl-CoA-carboxylase] ligase [Ignisphaera sp.]